MSCSWRPAPHSRPTQAYCVEGAATRLCTLLPHVGDLCSIVRSRRTKHLGQSPLSQQVPSTATSGKPVRHRHGKPRVLFGAVNWGPGGKGSADGSEALHSLDARAIFQQFADKAQDDALDVRQLSVRHTSCTMAGCGALSSSTAIEWQHLELPCSLQPMSSWCTTCHLLAGASPGPGPHCC